MFRKIFSAGAMAAAFTGAALLCGCSNKIEGNEQKHPTFIKAQSDKDAGHYADAAAGMNDLLDRAPKSALLHKELAGLYADNIGDNYRAIYHYQRYLDLAGAQLASEDQRLIQGYIANCKRKAALQQIEEDPTLAGGGNATASNDVSDKLLELDILRQHNKAFQNQLINYRNQIESLKAELANAQSAAAKAPVSQSAAAAESAPTAGEGDIYEVQPGDTLSKITRKMYGSDKAEYRKIIMRENGIDAPNKLRVGQKIRIPKLPR